MSDTPKKDAQGPKKPYVKPELKKVPLRPEEAVLGGCKTVSGGPLSGGSCDQMACLIQAS
jgi:hypothetical protein